MVDIAHLTVTPGSMKVTQSHTSWGLEIGRHRLSVTRAHEARIVDQTSESTRSSSLAKPFWPLAIGAFASISAFGLFVFGVVAAEPLRSRQSERYLVSLPVPVRATKSFKVAPIRKARTASISAGAGEWIGSSLSGSRFDAADEAYAVKAMHTGEFQEWLGPDGQRRFLVVGPEQEGDQRCRDLALLIRASDGSSKTRTARWCLAVPGKHAALAAKKDEQPMLDASVANATGSFSVQADAPPTSFPTNDSERASVAQPLSSQ